MAHNPIATTRLHNQKLIVTDHQTPIEVVEHMCAMQAQDYEMSKWAVAARLPNATEETIETAMNNGEIVRTHVLRPTWHLVAAKDVRWMLELTASQVNRLNNSIYKKYGMDEAIFNKATPIIVKSLRDNNYLTRAEIMEILQKEGFNTDDIRSTFYMFDAELKGIVCNGPRRGKQLTYALMDERIPPTKPLTRDEALVELAKRYFKSHAPATAKDFSWWSGLTLTDVRKAINLCGNDLIAEKINDLEYWFVDGSYPLSKGVLSDSISDEMIHLLPAFDEFMVSYADRTPSLHTDFTRNIITVNGIFKPIIVVNGEVIGEWKRTVKPKNVIVECSYFNTPNPELKTAIEQRFQQYEKYIGKPLIFV